MSPWPSVAAIVMLAVMFIAAVAWDVLRRAIASRGLDDRAKLAEHDKRLRELEQRSGALEEEVRAANTQQALRRR